MSVTQVGVGTTTDPAPNTVAIASIPTSTGAHACALRSDGKVRCWGSNTGGKLGDGTTTSRTSPVAVSGITTATQIAVGGTHTCALLADGTVKCWGANDQGQLGDGTTTNRSTPVSVTGLTGVTVTALAAGYQHSCALISDGTVKCWGDNTYSELGDNSTTDRTTATSPYGSLTGISQVAASPRETCVLLSSGAIKCWGSGASGRLGVAVNSSPYGRSTAQDVQNITTATKVTVGGAHACALLSTGSVKCWGNNTWGQLGNSSNSSASDPNKGTVTGITTAVDVSAGTNHTCATLTDGSVSCWGDNTYGELGDSTTTSHNAPVAATAFGTVSKLAPGAFAGCLVTSASDVRCIGLNDSGQIGDASTTNRTSAPVSAVGVVPLAPTISGLPTIASKSSSISATLSGLSGSTFTCILDAGVAAACTSPFSKTGLVEGPHTLSVTQTDTNGDTSAAATTTWSVDTVAPGAPTLGGIGSAINTSTASLTISGEIGATFVCSIDGATATNCSSPFAITGLSEGGHRVTVTQTDAAGNAGGEATLNWTVDTVAPAKPSLVGAPTGVSSSSSPTVSFTASETVTFKCSVDGAAFSACGNPFTLLNLVDGDHELSVKAVDAAGNESSAATASWTVDLVAPPVPWALQPISVSGGSSHTCSLMADATVQCWGLNDRGQLGNGSNTRATSPTPVSGISTATSVVAGSISTCALLNDETVKCWGGNSSGQLGNSSQSLADSATPVSVTGLTAAKQIVAGASHFCALLTDTTIRCWGSDTAGQLGDAGSANANAPVSVPGISGVKGIHAGIDHTCVLLTDGSAKCWGNGANGRLGNKSTSSSNSPVVVSGLSGATAIGGGLSHTCAVLSDTTVKCWGMNNSGEIGDGTTADKLVPTTVTGLSGVKQLDGGTAFTCALLSSATVSCWGANSSGQLGLGDGTFSQRTTFAPVVGASGAASIGLGSTNACMTLINGGVSCWGNNSSAQLGDQSVLTRDTIADVAFAHTLTGIPTAPSRSRSATVSFSAPGASSYTCALDSETPAACTSPLSLAGLADGAHTLAVRALDAGGNQSEPATGTWSVDNTPPAGPTISSKPNNPTNQLASSFVFAGEAGGAYTCSFDGADFSSCTSPASKTYPSGSDGNHSFAVQQTDSVGNVGSPTSVTWKIDTVKPSAPTVDKTADGTPPSYPLTTRLTTATVKILGEPSATFTCSIDGGAYASCESPMALSGLTDGTHAIYIKQTDAAGNTSASPTADPAQLKWIVDTTAPPQPTVSGIPSAPTKNKTASLNIGGTEAGSTLRCTLDGTVAGSCPNPWAISALADGSHTAKVEQIDGAGNVSDAAIGTWTVDTIAPAAPSISGAPTGTVNASGASLTITGEPSATFTCKQDTLAWTACGTNPFVVAGLSNASHTIYAKQTDLAGNTSDAASVTWTVNRVAPPAPTKGAAPEARTKSRTASLTFSGIADTTFRCSIDGGDFNLCNSKSLTLTNLVDGVHTVQVTQTSLIGNTSDPLTISWEVDNTGPAPPTITAAPSEFTRDTGIVTPLLVSFTGEDGATFSCQFDQDPATACASPQTFSGISEGMHTLTITPTDQLGNVGTKATASWTIDTSTPKSATITGQPDTSVSSRSATFTFNAASDETSPTFTCQFEDSGTASPCTSPVTLTKVTDGHHKFYIRVIDRAGNRSGSKPIEWNVDATAPTAPTFIAVPSGVVTSGTSSINATGELGSPYSCTLDGLALSNCTPPISLLDLDPGVHRFEIWQIDAAKNVGAHSVAAWTVDPIWPQSSAQASTGSQNTCAFGGSSGKITCWGLGTDGRSTAPDGRFARLSVGWDHSCAISTTGTATCWGKNLQGQATAPQAPQGQSFMEVSAGGEHSCALLTTGEARCWGADGYGQTEVPENATWEHISAGSAHTCAIALDLSISCWGNPDNGRLTAPSGQYSKISAGLDSSCAITVTGLARCWGSNAGSKATAITAQYSDISVGDAFACGVTTSGGINCWGAVPNGLTAPSGKWLKVSVGLDHVCGTQTNETVLCWGSNSNGKSTVPEISQPGQPDITSGPEATTADNYAIFTFSGVTGNTFECTLDGSAWKACATPMTYTSLSEGSHQFNVRQVSKTGTPGDPTTANFAVDATAPALPTVAVGSADVSTSVIVTFSGETGGSFECAVDSTTAFTACASPTQFDDLTEAQHTVSVRQIDVVGNVGQARVVRFTVDLTPPSAPTISGQPKGASRLTSVKIGLMGEGKTTTGLQCKLDAAAWADCATPLQLTGLAQGNHSFSARQLDPSGNIGAVKSVSWITDTTPPALVGKVAAKKAGKNTVVTSAFDKKRGAPTLLEFNNGKKAPSPKAPNNKKLTLKYAPKLTVAKQSAVVWVRVSDAAGNWSAWIKTK